MLKRLHGDGGDALRVTRALRQHADRPQQLRRLRTRLRSAQQRQHDVCGRELPLRLQPGLPRLRGCLRQRHPRHLVWRFMRALRNTPQRRRHLCDGRLRLHLPHRLRRLRRRGRQRLRSQPAGERRALWSLRRCLRPRRDLLHGRGLHRAHADPNLQQPLPSRGAGGSGWSCHVDGLP